MLKIMGKKTFTIYAEIFCLSKPVVSQILPSQGFSLALSIGHSLKIAPDVREFAVRFGQFVRDDFRKQTLYGNA